MSEVPIHPPGTGKRWSTKEAKIKEALDVLKQRGVKHDYCPRCEVLDRDVDLIDITAESSMVPSLFLRGLTPPPSGTGFNVLAPIRSQSGFISLMAVVCRNCGYTMFHNLDMLGISVK